MYSRTIAITLRTSVHSCFLEMESQRTLLIYQESSFRLLLDSNSRQWWWACRIVYRLTQTDYLKTREINHRSLSTRTPQLSNRTQLQEDRVCLRCLQEWVVWVAVEIKTWQPWWTTLKFNKWWTILKYSKWCSRWEAEMVTWLLWCRTHKCNRWCSSMLEVVVYQECQELLHSNQLQALIQPTMKLYRFPA